MKLLLSAGLVVGLCAVLPAADPGTPAAEVEKLTKELGIAQQRYAVAVRDAQKALKDASTDAEKKQAERKLEQVKANGPGAQFPARFLAIAEANPRNPAALDAINMVLQSSRAQTSHGLVAGKDSVAVRTRAIALLRTNWSADPKILPLLRIIGTQHDEAANALLRDVMARNSDRKVQAIACNTLVHVLTSDRATLKEGEEMARTLHKKYSDIFPDLSIGQKAPEIISEGIDGRQTRLSALRGKVVVLDVWTTWCHFCKEMIPHERAMVEKLKGKPFVLVSVSCDTTKKKLTDFLEKEKMPWTHWWNGDHGGVMDPWDIRGFPTIYVIDANGVIRYTNVRGEKLEQAVQKLLKELEERKGK